MATPFTLLASGTCWLGPNSGKRVAGTNAFDVDSAFATVESFVNGALAVWQRVGVNTRILGGLTQTRFPTTPNYYSFDYAIYSNQNGTAEIWEAGSKVADAGTYLNGSVFKIVYDGVHVKYYIDGALKHTTNASANLTLYFGGCINETSAALTNLEFSIPEPVAFTPLDCTPDASPPTAFTPPSFATDTNPPDQFFPGPQFYATTAEMAEQPTVLVTAGATIVVFVGTPTAWSTYTLTAGAHAADSTHVQPLDYNASTNAKTWVKTATYP
jgi:hypothetical protein